MAEADGNKLALAYDAEGNVVHAKDRGACRHSGSGVSTGLTVARREAVDALPDEGRARVRCRHAPGGRLPALRSLQAPICAGRILWSGCAS
jgi:hypothetical protein